MFLHIRRVDSNANKNKFNPFIWECYESMSNIRITGRSVPHPRPNEIPSLPVREHTLSKWLQYNFARHIHSLIPQKKNIPPNNLNQHASTCLTYINPIISYTKILITFCTFNSLPVTPLDFPHLEKTTFKCTKYTERRSIFSSAAVRLHLFSLRYTRFS